jgi:ABC-type proline/glycine betaine transport system permease subunit
MNCFMRVALLTIVTVAFAAPAQARVTNLDILRTEPAFGGASFGETGTYEHVVARSLTC